MTDTTESSSASAPVTLPTTTPDQWFEHLEQKEKAEFEQAKAKPGKFWHCHDSNPNIDHTLCKREHTMEHTTPLFCACSCHRPVLSNH